MVRYLGDIKTLAVTGAAVGAGVASANIVSAYAMAWIPVLNTLTGQTRSIVHNATKFLYGWALVRFSDRLAARGQRGAGLVEYAGYGALGAAFSDVIMSLFTIAVPMPSYGYNRWGPMNTPRQFGSVPNRQFGPAAHVTGARPSYGNVPKMGASVGPATNGPPRPVNATRPQLVRVSSR